MIAALAPLADRLARSPSRNEILEAHGRLEASPQLYTPAKPHRERLAIVHERLAEFCGLSVSCQECQTYGRSVGDRPAFADTSLFHDHVPANRLGLTSCWIHRRHADEDHGATRPPESRPRFAFRFESMRDLAAAHAAELKG